MNFGQALEAMKTGACVSREGWNGKNMFVYLVESTTVEVKDLRGQAKVAAIVASSLEPVSLAENGARKICGHIDMKAADGSLVIGWLASQTDMLADDWGIVDAPNKTFGVKV